MRVLPCLTVLLAACSCVGPAVKLDVSQWRRQRVDGYEYIFARVTATPGLKRLVGAYGQRLRLWIGPKDALPLYCLHGYLCDTDAVEYYEFWFRPDQPMDYTAAVMRSDVTDLRLVIQAAYSYEVVAVVEGVETKGMGLR